MPSPQKWLISLATCTVLVAAAYLWLDRPIAIFSHGTFAQAPIFIQLTYVPEPLVPLSLVTLFILGLWALAGQKLIKPHRVAMLCSASLIVAETAKSELKFIFGRTWPETWVNNNPSLIHDGVYGFNFFHGGAGYASFPSGHTTATCAVASVLWICYPRLRALYVAIIGAVVVGLIGADYHFLSDIIAGGFIGTTTGWFAVLLQGEKAPEPLPTTRPIGFLH